MSLSKMDSFLFLSACFQSLFNLLEFQRLVLHYSPPVRVQDLPRNQKVNHHHHTQQGGLGPNPSDQYVPEMVALEHRLNLL